jgi:hypothetical protein
LISCFLGIYEHKMHTWCLHRATMCPESLTRKSESNFYLSHTNYRYFLNTHNKILRGEKKGWSKRWKRERRRKEIPFSNMCTILQLKFVNICMWIISFFGILCKQIEPDRVPSRQVEDFFSESFQSA